MTLLWIAFALALILGALLVWRFAGWACPPWLVPLLENPYVESVAGAETVLERAGVGPGLQVLDAGCGPGRLSVPASRRVGASGRVVALDFEPRMLEKLAARVAAESLTNVEPLEAGLGDGKLPAAAFDVALLVTVLGEVPDKLAALREIHRSLRPGGVLSVTEVLPDPHYQRLARVRDLAAAAGFRERRLFSGWVSYTLNLGKDAAAVAAPPAGS
jgi:ubiquinone/menaquinone biosynthesis C-methylase UbiE